MSVTVCIGTFGDREHWGRLARRAAASVEAQTVAPADIIHCHADTLHDARNGAAAKATSDWLCFLDADDELDERYIEAMSARAARFTVQSALIQPSTLGVYPDGREDPQPVLIPTRPLLTGNYMVIGTLIRRDQFERVGGFDDLPCFEDWDLWLRAWRDGARLVAAPRAIYRVHVNDAGRNNTNRPVLFATFQQIQRRHTGKVS